MYIVFFFCFYSEYAEAVERNLKQMGLTVDLLFPNNDVPIGKVLHSISSRGCLYAILVNQQHQDNRSISLNILYGQPVEHRNIPVEDALDMIEKDFEKLRRGRDSCDGNVPFHTLKTQSIPSQGFKHPDSMQYLITLLYENRSLTVLQFDTVIKYLQEQREVQYNVELGGPMGQFAPTAGGSRITETPEVENEKKLQEKILHILNKPPITGPPPSQEPAASLPSRSGDRFNQFNNQSYRDSAFPSTKNRNEATQPPILNDPKVQKALDSLFSSNTFNF